MALIPLNAFKNIAAKLSVSEQLMYETPEGVSTIILSAMCSNYTTSDVNVTFKIQKTVDVGGTPTTLQYYIIPDITVPSKDVLSVISGRLVLEQGDRIYAMAASANSIDFIMSANEAANE